MTLRGEPELIMSCTHDSLKFGGLKFNGIYLTIICMIDKVTACTHIFIIALDHDQ